MVTDIDSNIGGISNHIMFKQVPKEIRKGYKMARVPEGKAGQGNASRQGCSMSHVPGAETGKMYGE